MAPGVNAGDVVEFIRDDGSQVRGDGLKADVRRGTIRFSGAARATLVTIRRRPTSTSRARPACGRDDVLATALPRRRLWLRRRDPQ